MTNRPKTPPHTVFLAFSGKKQSGKDTAAEIAANTLRNAGKSVRVTAFAEPLKDIAINLLGIPRDLVYGSNSDKENPTHILWDTMPMEVRLKYNNERCEFSGQEFPRTGPMTVREVLQILGTDIFRIMIDSNIWANAPFVKDWDYDVVILTDCRFPNEKEATEQNGGVVARLIRDTPLRDEHASETALDNHSFHYVYENNSSLEDLQEFVRDLLKKLELI